MSSKVGQLSRNDIHQRTAALWSPYGDDREEGGNRGTGFWLGKDRLLTANHVCASNEVHYRWSDSRKWQTDGRVLARDEALDVAVVEIAPRNRDSESTRAWFFRPTEKFEANFIGYPKAQEINGKLRILDVDALCMPFEGSEDDLLRGRTKRDYSLSGDEWGGISGAGFILNGALAGVVIEAGKDMVQARTLSVLVDKSPVWPYIASCLIRHESSAEGSDAHEVKLSRHLERLHQRRGTFISSGQSTDDIDKEILDTKRKLRAGPQLIRGDILRSRYKLVETIGSGGFATVWKAWDGQLRQYVAMKVLHGQYSNDKTRRDRFFRGARVMAKLSHPHIVRVLDPYVEDGGYYAFVMELIEGGNLRSYLRKEKMKAHEFFQLMLSVGKGVSLCHEQKILHRDLKPANILLTASMLPKVSDFDLVKVADTTGGTRTGAMGTFVYAAPECLENAGEVDARADVYSLTMMNIVGLLGGKEPHPSKAYNPPKLTGSLPIEKSLQEFLVRGISLEPSERPENASIWTEELQGLIKPKPPKKKSSELWVPGEDTRLSIGGVSFKMIWIEPGTFWMGSPDDDEEAFDWEKPHHKVTLTGFWMAETPCTQALWEAMTGKNPSEFKGAQNPVDNVSWDDIQAVLRALNERQSNLGLRLPTEAEWEYACRAGTQTPRYGKLDEVAWHRGNSWGTTHPVGQKAPNPWGLYDTLGNVWEWCQDLYGPYSKTPVVNPLGPKEDVNRVLRGGSWSLSARDVRAAYRFHDDPALRGSLYGFRLSRGHGAPSQSESGARRAESASKSFQSKGGGPGSKRGTSATKVPDPGVKTAPSSRIEPLIHPFEVGLDISQKPTWAESIEKNEWGVWATIRIEHASVFSFWRRPVLFRMRWCPPGEFWMGSSDGDKEAWDDEKPRHHVTLTEGFWIAETPCTQALWLAMTGKNPSEFKGAQNPVENVSWRMIQTALEALNKRQPTLGLRLPTEAEWEYACRAGAQTPRYGRLDEVAWYDGNSNRTTHPVGQKTPNPWGLYDTLGNAWEWCQDWRGPYTYSKTPVVNPLGPQEGVYRVLRGGSWNFSAQNVRAAYRYRHDPAFRDSSFGFRLSRGHGAPSQSGARRA